MSRLHAYQCMLDPELPPSGSFRPLFVCRERVQPPRFLRVRHADCDWFAELGASELERKGLTGIFETASDGHALVVLDGRGYFIDTGRPGAIEVVPLEPIKQVVVLAEQGLVLVLSPWQAAAYAQAGRVWVTDRFGGDGLRFLRATREALRLAGDLGEEDREWTVSCDTGQLVSE